MIHELAIYEKEPAAVHATEAKLRSTLSFPPFGADSGSGGGYAKTLLVFPPTFSASTDPEKPAGMALFFHNYSTWRAAPGVYLEDLFVREQFRGKGYGRRLLQELAGVVREVGGERLEWSVLKWNEPSIKFYVGDSVRATRMEEWVGMRVDGGALTRLAEGSGRAA